jgi:hypothetical protein
MNPIEQLLMASRGHQGLPMTIGGPPGPGGGVPAGPAPAIAAPGGGSPPSGGGDSDQSIAAHAAQQLLQAISQAHDPALKASLANALTALHKYTAQAQKEHHDALAGKFSPRLMAQSRGA